MRERIVVTAAGVVSSIGTGWEAFEAALFAGEVGVGESDRLHGARVAEVRDFRPQQWLGEKGMRTLDRGARLLTVASHLALCSNVPGPPEESGGDSVGLVCGTVFASLHSIVQFDWSAIEDGRRLVNPAEFPNTVLNSPAGHAAIWHRLTGVNSTVCVGLASGLAALRYASDFLQLGRAGLLLAGGMEELSEESLLGLTSIERFSATGNARPFAPERDGVVPGEAAALCLLETASHALRRGARPLFELAGFGEGSESMMEALSAAGVNPPEIGCVVASANGSVTGDAVEESAFGLPFGHRQTLPVCAPKAAYGEAMGASGALAVVAGGMALLRQSAPPTPGGSPSAGGLLLTMAPQPFAASSVLVNSFGPNGNNISVVLRSWAG